MMRFLVAMLLAASLGACATAERVAVPESLIDEVSLAGYDDIRFWGDAEIPRVEERTQNLLALLAEQNTEAIRSGAAVQVSFLAISGGGGNGAFGAGLLNGWTDVGGRPSFRIVSGVSTGAIIAPFAFLGAQYDQQLRYAYTEIRPNDIYRASILPNLFAGPALADAAPLEELIAGFADAAFLRAIAAEHAKGRRLYVTTTNLDTGRPVVWDMGAIAASSTPEAAELFRKIILASASLPGIFPPVRIEVVHNGRSYTELHMDGGLTSQVFAYHPQVELGRLLDSAGFDVRVNVYVIWNGRRTPAYLPAELRWYEIIERAVDIQFNHQGLGDIAGIYALTQRDGAQFRLAMIPEEFEETPDELFEQDYMRALFEVGVRSAANPDLWLSEPP